MASVLLSGTPAELANGISPPQSLSLAGNTIALSDGGGSVDVAAATTVAATAQKTTALTYTPGFLQTDVAGRFAVGVGSIIGSTITEGGTVTVSRAGVNPKVELNREDIVGGVGTIEFTGAAFTFNPPLTDSDFQTLSLLGNELTISGGNTVDLSGMPVITALQTKTQNQSAVAGTTTFTGELSTSNGDVNIHNGTQPSVNYFNSANIQKATVDYAELTDKITMVATNVALDTTQAGYPRVILDAGGAVMRADDKAVKMERYETTGSTIDTSLTLNATDVTVALPNGYSVVMDGGNSYFYTSLPQMKVNSGAVEGVEIGLDSGINIVRGYGLPLTIAQDVGKQSTDFMVFDTGSGSGGINITSSEYFDAFATKEARIQSGESIKLTSALHPSTAPSVAVKNLTGNCVLDLEPQGGKGGQIIADEGAQVIILKGRDGFNAGITGASLVAISTEDTASAIGMTAGPAGANIDIVANGDDTGKISMIAQTSLTAAEFTIDGSTTVGIINAFADQINIGANGASATVSIGTPNATISIDEASVTVQVSGKLIPEGGILDVGGTLGTSGQVLTSTGSQVSWQTLPIVWGSFSSSATQSAAGANTTTITTYNTTQVASNCSLGGGNTITTSKACSKIRIQASIIASSTSPTTKFRFWLIKNGTAVANSCSEVSIKDANDQVLCVCEWFETCANGTTFQVGFQSDNVSGRILAVAAGGVSPNAYPATPSIILTLQGFV